MYFMYVNIYYMNFTNCIISRKTIYSVSAIGLGPAGVSHPNTSVLTPAGLVSKKKKKLTVLFKHVEHNKI